MKIVELGKCIDNNDPLGLGRIRVEMLEKINSSREKSVVDYKPWDVYDPFLFYPFLPPHINVVPQFQQLVKLIFWDVNNSSLNREYIAGPYINAYDFNSQGADRQLQATSSGHRIVREPNLFNPKTNELLDPKTKGVIGKPEDVIQYGHYGTDIIHTRNGVNIRAGKLDDPKTKKTNRPIFNNKPARFGIKKFDETLEYKTEEITTNELQHKALSSLVEYYVDLNTTGTTYNGNFRLFKIVKQVYNETDTYNFDQNKNVADNNKALVYEKIFSGLTLTEIGRDICQQLRIVKMAEAHSELNPAFYGSPLHPFYYKPSQQFYADIISGGTVSKQKADTLLSNVNLGNSGSYGLCYATDINENYVPIKQVKKQVQKEIIKNEPTSIYHLISDMCFLLSYEANVPQDAEKINFAALDNYEPTQEQILKEILPKTYSNVRGEPLLYLLQLMVDFMLSHVHNPAEIGIAPKGLKEELLKELQSAKEKIINQKLRIN